MDEAVKAKTFVIKLKFQARVGAIQGLPLG